MGRRGPPITPGARFLLAAPYGVAVCDGKTDDGI